MRYIRFGLFAAAFIAFSSQYFLKSLGVDSAMTWENLALGSLFLALYYLSRPR